MKVCVLLTQPSYGKGQGAAVSQRQGASYWTSPRFLSSSGLSKSLDCRHFSPLPFPTLIPVFELQMVICPSLCIAGTCPPTALKLHLVVSLTTATTGFILIILNPDIKKNIQRKADCPVGSSVHLEQSALAWAWLSPPVTHWLRCSIRRLCFQGG